MAKQNLLTSLVALIVGTSSLIGSTANAQAPCKHEELYPAALHFHDSVEHLQIVASTCAPSHAEFLLTQRLSQKACAILEAVERRDPWSGILCDYGLAKNYMQTIATRLDQYCLADLDRKFVCAWETAVSDWAVLAALVEPPRGHHHSAQRPTWYGRVAAGQHGLPPGLSLQSQSGFRGLPSSSFQLSVQTSGNRSSSIHRSGYSSRGRSSIDPREQFGSPFGNSLRGRGVSPTNRGAGNFPSPFPTSNTFPTGRQSNLGNRSVGPDDLRSVLINSLINRMLN